MSTLGVIGSGEIGTAVARLAVAAGMDVVVSNSRGPETLTDLVADLGERARAGTVVQAATGDTVLLAVPLRAVRSLPVDLLTDKLVLDASNYYPERDAAIAELDRQELTTSELVQRHLVGARIVKAFNSIGSRQIVTRARPHGAADRSALPIAGDDAEARQAAGELLDRLGFDVVEVGGLADSWRIEPNTPAYVRPYMRDVARATTDEVATSVPTAPAPIVPVDALRDLVASAVRGPAGGEWPSGRPIR
jgi:8-hydroxy-5-deazaflavin:NADPH oxidoreductase